MNKKNTTITGLGLIASCNLFSLKNEANTKPNFIIIMADDLGYSDIGCFGNTDVKTPNLDRMAAEGLLFTDYHSNGAVSTPTRAALLTGRYQQRAGLEGVILEIPEHKNVGLQPQEVTFANVLKNNGYKTAIIGKWHLGSLEKYNPLNHGFDKFVGFKTGNVDYQSHIDRKADLDWWDGLENKDMPGYSTELITSKSIDFITENKNKPFCLYVAHAAPHNPCQAPTDPAFRKLGVTNPLQRTPKDYSVKNSRKAMIEYMDKGIGETFTRLKKLGLNNRTLVIFMSDNGPLSREGGSATPLRGGKNTLFEGGHRVPCIMYMPGTITGGNVSNQTVIGMDLFPTMLEMAGIKYNPKNRPLDGVSLLPIIKGKKIAERTLFWKRGSDYAVRDGFWKLVITGKQVLLFDLSKDISETNNLAVSNPEVVKSLETKLQIWKQDVESGFPEQLNLNDSNTVRSE